jgi:hypothetical protein
MGHAEFLRKSNFLFMIKLKIHVEKSYLILRKERN